MLLYRRPARWLAKRRGTVICLVALIAVAIALADQAGPMSVVGSESRPFWFFVWPVALVGAAIRLWAAGNLAKNQEVTRTGVYRLVRHPLYVGNILIYATFLVALDRVGSAAPVLLAVLLLLHYTRMLHEEERLRRDYPDEFARAAATPRMLAKPWLLPEALATNRFCWRRAWTNRGWRGFWGPLLLPVFAYLLDVIRLS
jgi:protein-S-isoprenylcysteine O-methyltransferase Ste14